MANFGELRITGFNDQVEEFFGGKIKSVTQEKIRVLSLRAQLPNYMQIVYSDKTDWNI